MRVRTYCVLVLLLSLWVLSSKASAASKWSSWGEIVEQMDVSLNNSYDAYLKKDVEEGKKWVNDAYYGYYEKEGIEKTVMAYISGTRASTVEYQFSVAKKLMTDGASDQEVRASLDLLSKMLHEDADKLDGKEENQDEEESQNPFGVFLMSLIIMLREGSEAILIVAAIAAYLIRSGNGRQTRVVYMSGVAALVASAFAAIALQVLFEVSGANQEIIEGAAMLLAVVVLFFVSNWMVSKAESEAWKNYIEGKVQTAVETGSSFALGAAAFLAVFREGAETILFYQALLARGTHSDMVWGGFAVGCVALVAIFVLVRYGSLVIPIRAFFLGTSILMYIMSVAFAGGGVQELQEAEVVGKTWVMDFNVWAKFFESHQVYATLFDILGIYPTVETLLPQAVLLALAIVSVIYYHSKGKRSG